MSAHPRPEGPVEHLMMDLIALNPSTCQVLLSVLSCFRGNCAIFVFRGGVQTNLSTYIRWRTPHPDYSTKHEPRTRIKSILLSKVVQFTMSHPLVQMPSPPSSHIPFFVPLGSF
ncbi:hypothetical protein DPEC_G00371040 [Dallia pectoralis]|nr:hypothetical protein DPEC_G00371040 [Dallia pectoralis]